MKGENLPDLCEAELSLGDYSHAVGVPVGVGLLCRFCHLRVLCIFVSGSYMYVDDDPVTLRGQTI